MGIPFLSLEKGDTNEAVGTAVSCLQMAADPPSGRPLIGVVAGIQDVLLRMGKLAKEDHEAWRLGTIPYLERAIRLNLSQLKYMLHTLKDNAKKGGLQPSRTVYVSWGKRPRRPLRFSRSGNPGIEQAYATHFVTPRESVG